MITPTEREIFIKASRSHQILRQAVEAFRDYLKTDSPANSPGYYRARNLLKEGRLFCADAVVQAKKLLGPLPAYASREYEELKARALRENRIIVPGETPDDLRSQLAEDELLSGMMSPAEIDEYVRDHFETQSSGKRKLANIKVRMMIDKLLALVDEGVAAQKAAQRKQQGLPPE